MRDRILGMALGALFVAACAKAPQPAQQRGAPTLPSGDGAVTRAGLSKAERKAALQKASAKVLQQWGASSGNAKSLTAAVDPATDPTKIPHYFGPFSNWANSPLAAPDATVQITGDGTGATAEAVVGPRGAITAINVTNPGTGYSSATVTIVGGSCTQSNPPCQGAAAAATLTPSGAVTGISVGTPGAGYSAPIVTLSGGGASTSATATAYGGVTAVTVTDPGSGYTYPTVSFDMPDGPDGVVATGHVTVLTNQDGTPARDASGAVTITGVQIDSPGSGYSTAPHVAILNGTQYDPVARTDGSLVPNSTATATLSVQTVTLGSFGDGYTSAPSVTITDTNGGTGAGATATASVSAGGVTSIAVQSAGSGYVTAGAIEKFVDGLPGLGAGNANSRGQYIPIAVPDTTTYPGSDYYEIALVEYTEQMHRDLPPTKLRGYVQLETPVVQGSHAALPGGRFGVDRPHYLGPTIVAQKNRSVRITFYNLLPTSGGGDLFLPVDSTMMGSGMGSMTDPFDPRPVAGGSVLDEVRNPMCTVTVPKHDMCFKDNRATLHLHGGNTPWISDGTPHQWITPAGETTSWGKGVSVAYVPDMWFSSSGAPIPACAGSNTCNVAGATNNPGNGAETFFYTNQQSGRFMFYHDHAWGITRLNVYAGEAAGYVIRDATEQRLVAGGTIPADEIPLIIQDRTFVPTDAQLAQQDPTWDRTRWGGYGGLWYHHVYMPAQNPADPSGMSAFGRWMYGPWFWPPAGDTKYGPIANPYYDPNCRLDVPSTWQYATDPFCEPPQIPGTPNISAGMEQFNDTPIVNGTAYPSATLQPKAYRLRILNAANDRFFNLQWYVADSSGTEVALKASEVEAAQTDPNVFPTPDTTLSPAGPNWIQIGSEGGLLPAPAVIPPQPITWITDPTRFDFGNVDQHSLLVAPAERADVVVDFSAYAGKTLILYNDAPAAFPARVATYDYYTGAPDLSPVGAPRILPGYGPNTRTIMQVKIAAGSPQPFSLKALQTAFSHKANGSGAFEESQHPVIVGQAGYNSAYGASFAASGDCTSPGSTIKCDGFARINQQGGEAFTFDTLLGSKVAVTIEPKAIHDEMNASTFDEFGRMQANLGIEAVPATPGLTNVNLMPFTFPPTEVIDTTNLPRTGVVNGKELKVTPIAVGTDGTQIWKFTHNGVDTHPIHFHAFDVQVLNRVTWDNIIMPPDPNELGWKDTVRISPLEDTIVALRPVVPTLPWEVPNSVRLLDPMMPTWNGVVPDPTAGTPDQGVLASATVSVLLGIGIPPANGAGEPIDVYNHLVNFGGEYVYHCHILSHEEMDMMRPVVLAYPPKPVTDLAVVGSTLQWTDGSISETAYAVEKSTDGGQTWTEVWRVDRPLDVPNTRGEVLTAPLPGRASSSYRVVAENTVGDTWNYANPGTNQIVSGGFPTATAKSYSNVATVRRVSADFDGDLRSDLLWKNGTDLYAWFMNGAAYTYAYFGGPPSPWEVVGIGDFDGDGKGDVLWQSGTDMYIWFMDGAAPARFAYLAAPPGPWTLAAVGDFDGDGKADIFWRNGTDGYLWFMNGVSYTWSYVTPPPAPWAVAGVGDFDGDGSDDLLWRNGTDAYVWFLRGSAPFAFAYFSVPASPWSVAGVGDFDGDGISDVLWQNGADMYLWYMHGAAAVTSDYLGGLASPWVVANVGDYDGDGRADILWRNDTGLQAWFMNHATYTTSSYSGPPSPWGIVRP